MSEYRTVEKQIQETKEEILPKKQDAISELRITRLNIAHCRNKKSGETQHEICPSIEILYKILSTRDN